MAEEQQGPEILADDEPTIPAHEAVIPPEEPDSLMEILRHERADLAANRTVDIPVPGYTMLYVRYRLLDGPELDKIGTKVARETRDRWQRGLLAAIDTLIAACEGVYVDFEGRIIPLDPENRGYPLSYEQGLAEFMGFEADSARKVVLGVFASNEVAIGNHAIRLNRWMGNTNSRVDEDFLGETL